MTAFLRKLLLENFWWKLFSLALAVLIWLIVSFASHKETKPVQRTFSHLPVLILSATEDVHHFKVNPVEVEVTVQGAPRTLQGLGNKDIRPLVDLTGVGVARELRQRVEVSVPAGVMLTHVVPNEVQIIFPPDR